MGAGVPQPPAQSGCARRSVRAAKGAAPIKIVPLRSGAHILLRVSTGEVLRMGWSPVSAGSQGALRDLGALLFLISLFFVLDWLGREQRRP